MTWFDFASLFVFFCNLLFIVAAGLLLTRILAAVRQSRDQLADMVADSSGVNIDLRHVSKLMAKELERIHEDLGAKDVSAERAVLSLSRQLADLRTALQESLNSARSKDGSDSKPLDDGLTQRLRDKLKDVMTQNLQLKAEIERARKQIVSASESSDGLRSGISDIKGASPGLVKDLTHRVEQLSSDLAEARRRAQVAERMSETNAMKLDEMREQLSISNYQSSGQDSRSHQELRDQLEEMAAREKSFLARIELMEKELQRQLTEKSFIEERFVQLDAKSA